MACLAALPDREMVTARKNTPSPGQNRERRAGLKATGPNGGISQPAREVGDSSLQGAVRRHAGLLSPARDGGMFDISSMPHLALPRLSVPSPAWPRPAVTCPAKPHRAKPRHAVPVWCFYGKIFQAPPTNHLCKPHSQTWQISDIHHRGFPLNSHLCLCLFMNFLQFIKLLG